MIQPSLPSPFRYYVIFENAHTLAEKGRSAHSARARA